MTTPRRFRIWALAAAAALPLAGCFKSYVAVSFRPPALPPGSEQIAAAPALASARPALKAVAVQAPYGCLAAVPETRGGAGLAAHLRTLDEGRCELWLGALQEALARAGLRVVGWKELLAGGQQGETASAAAARLGADALLRVTAIDAVPLLATERDDDAVQLWSSNGAGDLLAPASLSPRARAGLVALAHDRYPDGALVGLRLTVEADLVRTGGEPLLAYRRTLADDLSGTLQARLLLRGRDTTWRPVRPAHVPAAGTPGGASPGAEDPLTERLRALARAVAADLVSRISGA